MRVCVFVCVLPLHCQVAEAAALGTLLARNLVNERGDVAHPQYFQEQAEKLVQECVVSIHAFLEWNDEGHFETASLVFVM